jgi:hypothetical protein
MGANRKVAEDVAQSVEGSLYDGISTEKILLMILRLLENHKPAIRHLLDLRKRLSLMDSKPEFEHFVQLLLSEIGYDVTSNQIIRGKCVEPEVDAVARKDGVTYFIEAKHHINYHTPTGLDESRIARAVLEDVTEGFNLGLVDLQIDGAMIITNTRFSEHARLYGNCRKIIQIGWSSPSGHALRNLIEEHNLHPLTCLKGLRTEMRRKMVSGGILLIKQLVEENPDTLARRIGVSKKVLERLIETARTSVSAIHYP